MDSSFENMDQTIPDLPTADLEDKHLTFFVSDQLFSLSIAAVIEIVQIQEITPMPELPFYAKGIINMRGRVIPVIDLNLRFGKMEQEYTERTCIIILEINGAQVGFIVDAVEEVRDLPADSISPPPAISGRVSSYVVGIGKLPGGKMVLVLDSRLLVSDGMDFFDMAGM